MVAQGFTICNLPRASGPCKAYIRRYYFDKEAGECKVFIYGGCEGNANNFKTLAACLETCNTCLLPEETGRCRAYFPRYYFDKEAGECKEFIYGGCDGNANRFESLAACQMTCNTCLLPEETGPCRAYFPRFYFNKRAGKCQKFIYGGCDGNANNFRTKRACNEKCN